MRHNILMTGPMYGPTIEELEKAYTVHRYWTAGNKEALVSSIAD